MAKAIKVGNKHGILQKSRLEALSTTSAASLLAAIAASPLLAQFGGPAPGGKIPSITEYGVDYGLGINFYDEEGNLKTTTQLISNANQKGEDIGENIILVEGEVVGRSHNGSNGGSGSARLQPCTATIEAQREEKAGLAIISRTTSTTTTTSTSTTCRHSATTGTHTSRDTASLIDQLLEENYRGQAETFARCASRTASSSASTRSFTRSLSGGSTSTQGKSPSFAEPKPNLPTIESSGLVVPTQQTFSVGQSTSFRTPNGSIIVQPYSICSGGLNPSFTAADCPSAYTIHGHRIFSVPTNAPSLIIEQDSPTTLDVDPLCRGPFYFTAEERQAIAELVLSKPYSCEKHTNCTDCRDIEYSFLENKAMPTSIPPDERQKIINSNRSLRNIKNELENLAENNAITDEAYDAILRSLPAESPLNGPAARSNTAPPPPAAPANPNNDSPPAYTSPNPPSLPSRTPSSQPEISRAIALYRYMEPGDCNFEVGDEIAVHKHMNADWWHGKNIRTGKEGVFPVNYVQAHTPNPPALVTAGSYGNEKANGYAGAHQQQQSGPPPPGPSNPYNSAVPPMRIAQQPTENKPGKGQDMGKKFGKKLGNAAVFGAGATIGGKLVNSIF